MADKIASRYVMRVTASDRSGCRTSLAARKGQLGMILGLPWYQHRRTADGSTADIGVYGEPAIPIAEFDTSREMTETSEEDASSAADAAAAAPDAPAVLPG